MQHVSGSESLKLPVRRKQPSTSSLNKKRWGEIIKVDENAAFANLTGCVQKERTKEVETTEDKNRNPDNTITRLNKPRGCNNTLHNSSIKYLHQHLKDRLQTANTLRSWLKRWDAGSKKLRKRMLIEFLRGNDGKTQGDLQLKYSNGLSLLLLRFTSSLRLTYLVGPSLSLHIRAITLLVSLLEKSYMHEFLESGTVLTLIELVTMTHEAHVSDVEKILALELLLLVARMGPTPKRVIGEHHGLDAIAKCMSNSDNTLLHAHATNLLIELGIGNPELAASCVGQLAALLRTRHRHTQISVCKAICRLLGNPDSCLFITPEQTAWDSKNISNNNHVKNTSERLLILILPAVSLIQEADGTLQQQGVALVSDLLAQPGLFLHIVKQLLLVLHSASNGQTCSRRTSTGWDAHGDNGDEAVGRNDSGMFVTIKELEVVPAKHPAWSILSLLDDLIHQAEESTLSTLCHAGVLSAIVSSMLNIHSYEVQKLATKICRNLCTRFYPAREGVVAILGEDLTILLINGSEINDGQIVREFIKSEELFVHVTGNLKKQGIQTNFRRVSRVPSVVPTAALGNSAEENKGRSSGNKPSEESDRGSTHDEPQTAIDTCDDSSDSDDKSTNTDADADADAPVDDKVRQDDDTKDNASKQQKLGDVHEDTLNGAQEDVAGEKQETNEIDNTFGGTAHSGQNTNGKQGKTFGHRMDYMQQQLVYKESAEGYPRSKIIDLAINKSANVSTSATRLMQGLWTDKSAITKRTTKEEGCQKVLQMLQVLSALKKSGQDKEESEVMPNKPSPPNSHVRRHSSTGIASPRGRRASISKSVKSFKNQEDTAGLRGSQIRMY